MDTDDDDETPYYLVELSERSVKPKNVWNFYQDTWEDPQQSTRVLVWNSLDKKWEMVDRNSAEWEVAELNWKNIEKDSDEWKAAELEWNMIELKKQKNRRFEKLINVLIEKWFEWIYDYNTGDNDSFKNLARRKGFRKENCLIRDQISYLRVRCGYDEDTHFLDFLKMLMPSGTMSSPIKMLNSNVIRYREIQYSDSRKEYEDFLLGLCKKIEIAPEIVLRISQFVSLLKKLPSEMYSDTFLTRHENPHEVSDPINWVSLRVHPI